MGLTNTRMHRRTIIFGISFNIFEFKDFLNLLSSLILILNLYNS